MHRLLVRLLLAASLPFLLALHPAKAEEQHPWPFRYLMIVEEEGMYYAGVRRAKEQRKANKPVDTIEGYLKPTLLVRRRNETGFALFLLEFDRKGRLLDAKTRRPTALRGLYDPRSNESVKLAHEKDPLKNRVILGFYNDDTQEFCKAGELARIFEEEVNPPDDTEPVEGYAFGCRAWRRQMNSPSVKIINVTSYAEGPSYIGEFRGHALFTDPKKPVWGYHLDRHYCLADCPEGRPGRVKWKAPFKQEYVDY